MQKTLTSLRPAPTIYRSSYRRDTDFTKFSNDDLKFALDVLSLHNSPYEFQCANEIEKRIMAGTWLDINTAPPSVEELPGWLKVFPFCLLWKQRPQR